MRVGNFDATGAARTLIQGAKEAAAKANTHEYDEVAYALEDLEQDAMGTASRIGDEAWAYYHATKSEVERLQQFPETGEERAALEKKEATALDHAETLDSLIDGKDDELGAMLQPIADFLRTLTGGQG